MMRVASPALALLSALLTHSVAQAREPALAADVTMTGDLSRDDFRTYRYETFSVPKGVDLIRLRVETSSDDPSTAIDIGLEGPGGLRGWSGGERRPHIDVGRLGASPGYVPGPIEPGDWKVIIGTPNIREGASATYAITVEFNPPSERINARTGWLRGDFHVHTGHGDAKCAAASGGVRRCPAHLTVEGARAADLDFIAITDHNTTSGHAAAAELQGHHDDIVLIPGMEVTTFDGHANAFGLSRYLDFRIDRDRDFARLARDVADQGAILSINHPLLIQGEACMGCGWEVPDVDYGAVAAVEAVNGATLARLGSVETPLSGVEFWERLLDRGYRVTAIGGSDNHDPTPGAPQPPIGIPTTVVWSEAASVDAILAGVRSGRVYIDVVGQPAWRLDLEASTGGQSAVMGGALSARAGDVVRVEALVAGAEGGTIEFIAGGRDAPLGVGAISGGNAAPAVTFAVDRHARWVRAVLRSPGGKIALISNPVYIDIVD
ncbi:MAG: PHP domain-containing protein [Alphaproteobacteria bacterium]|nr:PHP domain-containing protein [Alphaproteobacteria bacterium]